MICNVAGYLTTGSLTSHKPVSAVTPTIQNNADTDHNLWSHKILPPYNSDKILPPYNSDKILPHSICDKIMSHYNSDNILPSRSGKIDVESPLVSECGRQQISELHNSDRKYQLASDKTTDIGNNNQGFKHYYEVTDTTRPVLNRSHSVTEQCPARLSRLDTARRSASMVGRTVSSDRYNSDRYNSDRQCRDNILHLLASRLHERQDGRQGR